MNAHGVFEAAENKAGQEFSDVLCTHLEQAVSDREPSPVEAQRPQESQRAPLVSGEETEEYALKRPLGDVDVLVARSAALRAAAADRGLAAFDPGSAAAFIDHIVS